MSNHTFKPGDIVVFKCGSAEMVVNKIVQHSDEEMLLNPSLNDEPLSVECVWHDKQGRPHREVFAETSLQMA